LSTFKITVPTTATTKSKTLATTTTTATTMTQQMKVKRNPFYFDPPVFFSEPRTSND